MTIHCVPSDAGRVLRRGAVVIVALVAALTVVSGPVPATRPAPELRLAAEPFDPEVVLPGRVDAALHRTFWAVERSVVAVDAGRRKDARRSLRAAAIGFDRSHRAVLRQVQAVSDPEAEEESTAGPDSALASLNVTQVSVAMLAGLFDRLRAAGVVTRIRAALVTAQRRRAALLQVIIGLDPEGAGAAYADALADTVPGYTDEAAGLAEALADDRLTRAARRALTAALARSRAMEAVMIATFGGGE